MRPGGFPGTSSSHAPFGTSGRLRPEGRSPGQLGDGVGALPAGLLAAVVELVALDAIGPRPDPAAVAGLAGRDVRHEHVLRPLALDSAGVAFGAKQGAVAVVAELAV